MKTIANRANAIPIELLRQFAWRPQTQRPDECWPWLGARRADGYGVIKHKGKQYKAHRVAYQLAHGSLDRLLTIDHLCRNKGCVNPSHMEAVTQSVNVKRYYAT